jgi:8-oxo-dGTP pyrophosphatase MutT (NUDIX family)
MMTAVESRRDDRVSAAVVSYRPTGDGEQADVRRLLEVLEVAEDPWSRSEPVHLTASALIVSDGGDRLLLRWHERFSRFQHVGGHGDLGESDPLAVVLREAQEETGLKDLRPVSPPAGAAGDSIIHIAVVPVPAREDEPAHEHADLRYVLETSQPEDARPESPSTPVRWLSWDEAFALVTEPNLRELLVRAMAVVSS